MPLELGRIVRRRELGELVIRWLTAVVDNRGNFADRIRLFAPVDNQSKIEVTMVDKGARVTVAVLHHISDFGGRCHARKRQKGQKHNCY
jgi:hypothetical protein